MMQEPKEIGVSKNLIYKVRNRALISLRRFIGSGADQLGDRELKMLVRVYLYLFLISS